jgi:hypothetical protein
MSAITSNNKIALVWNKTRGKCWYCGVEFDYSTTGHFTIDHIIPLDKNGNNEIENLVPCCKSCNAIKKNRSIDDIRLMYQRQLGMVFDIAQTLWLNSKGITIPEPDPYLFYFEKEGLK